VKRCRTAFFVPFRGAEEEDTQEGNEQTPQDRQNVFYSGDMISGGLKRGGQGKEAQGKNQAEHQGCRGEFMDINGGNFQF
jgi:hypothetical protein